MLKPPKPRQQFKVENYTGNINLFARPQVKNKDGSISTLYSMSFNDPATNKEVLIPRVGITNGMPTIWSEQQAINNYYSTGKHLGKFATPEEANAMAEILHNQQARYYNGK